MKHHFIKMFEEVWNYGLIHRPDPLGYCVICMDMYNVVRISKMSVIERQIEKGYMKRGEKHASYEAMEAEDYA